MTSYAELLRLSCQRDRRQTALEERQKVIEERLIALMETGAVVTAGVLSSKTPSWSPESSPARDQPKPVSSDVDTEERRLVLAEKPTDLAEPDNLNTTLIPLAKYVENQGQVQPFVETFVTVFGAQEEAKLWSLIWDVISQMFSSQDNEWLMPVQTNNRMGALGPVDKCPDFVPSNDRVHEGRGTLGVFVEEEHVPARNVPASKPSNQTLGERKRYAEEHLAVPKAKVPKTEHRFTDNASLLSDMLRRSSHYKDEHTHYHTLPTRIKLQNLTQADLKFQVGLDNRSALVCDYNVWSQIAQKMFTSKKGYLLPCEPNLSFSREVTLSRKYRPCNPRDGYPSANLLFWLADRMKMPHDSFGVDFAVCPLPHLFKGKRSIFCGFSPISVRTSKFQFDLAPPTYTGNLLEAAGINIPLNPFEGMDESQGREYLDLIHTACREGIMRAMVEGKYNVDKRLTSDHIFLDVTAMADVVCVFKLPQYPVWYQFNRVYLEDVAADNMGGTSHIKWQFAVNKAARVVEQNRKRRIDLRPFDTP